MKQLLQNAALSAALIVPTAIALVALEFVHVVPGNPSRRLVIVRRVLWVLSALCLAALGVLIVARFVELRIQ